VTTYWYWLLCSSSISWYRYASASWSCSVSTLRSSHWQISPSNDHIRPAMTKQMFLPLTLSKMMLIAKAMSTMWAGKTFDSLGWRIRFNRFPSVRMRMGIVLSENRYNVFRQSLNGICLRTPNFIGLRRLRQAFKFLLRRSVLQWLRGYVYWVPKLRCLCGQGMVEEDAVRKGSMETASSSGGLKLSTFLHLIYSRRVSPSRVPLRDRTENTPTGFWLISLRQSRICSSHTNFAQDNYDYPSKSGTDTTRRNIRNTATSKT